MSRISILGGGAILTGLAALALGQAPAPRPTVIYMAQVAGGSRSGAGLGPMDAGRVPGGTGGGAPAAGLGPMDAGRVPGGTGGTAATPGLGQPESPGYVGPLGAPRGSSGSPTQGTKIDRTAKAGAQGGRTAQAQVGTVDDRLFAAAVALSGLSEVSTGQLAEQRAARDDVKQFARRMIEDHTRSNQELQSLAAAKRMALPNVPGIKDQARLNILGGLTGEPFDQAYLEQQRAAHIDTLALFEAEAERGRDPQIKAFAAKTVPKLREHLQQLEKQMRTASRDTAQPRSNQAPAGTRSGDTTRER